VQEPTSDEILMAAYQAGSQAAFTALFERHGGSVYGFLARRLPDRALAEDLYQEAFLRLHRGRHTYDDRRPFRAWLFAIVHNLLNDALRDHARNERRGLVRAGSPDVDGGILAETQAGRRDSADGSPEAITSARESMRALDAAIRGLPGDEATVLILARLEGLSYDDIALVIGRSPSATKQLAYRALKRVRAEMVATGHGESP
jgi:RNA polymerase sigma-70 factor (ECF subfamily)